MAKKKKNDDIENIADNKKEESAGSKIVSALIVLIIIAIWLGVFAILIKLDVGGFGSNVLAPVLKDVPIINKILPGTPYEDTSGQRYKNLEEALARINELEKQIASMSSAGTANTDYITQLETENTRLKTFENEQLAFRDRVTKFDNEVVFGKKSPSIEEYKAFYEEINPDNAADLYQKVVKQMAADESIKVKSAEFVKMDPASAAEILEVMTGDLDLVCKILQCMKPEQSAAILQEMTAEYAAKITKRSSVMD